MNSDYINKYFRLIEDNLNRDLNSDKVKEEDKKGISYRLHIINELKYNFLWHVKSSHEKQIARIRKLASMRRANDLLPFIQKQELAIQIYNSIEYTLPYISALDLSDAKQILLDFCINWTDKIDFAGDNYRGDLPNKTEIEHAFNPYFAVHKYNMFKECYEKIQRLYLEIMNLSEIVE